MIDRFEEQLRLAFPTRIQVVEHGGDPEVEPEKIALRAFFDWTGRTEGDKADPKTVHAFVHANGTAITGIGADLPPS
jgi:hypothetical protein